MSTAVLSEPAAAARPSREAIGFWLWLVFLLAVAGLAGSLYLSLGMSLKACPLCFYQRTFVMSLVAVLGMGLLLGAGGGARLGLLGLPLAAAGLGVACFHVFLELRGKLECPAGLLGLGSAPQQSLVLFAALTAMLFLETIRTGGKWRFAQITGALAIGGLLALASCTSNPPLPSPPSQPYAQPPDVCRPPHPGS